MKRAKSVCKLMLSISLLLLAQVSASPRDSWGAPEPMSFGSRGLKYVAEVFPPHCRQNPGDRPLCYFYEMGYPGTRWDIIPKLIWKAELSNSRMPHQAIVSLDGEVVTLNEFGTLGYENSVVIYDRKGQMLKSYHFDNLFLDREKGLIENSVSSRWWNQKARYFFLRNPSRLYILLEWGKVLEFSLHDAALRKGVLGDFPEMSISKERWRNEEVEVWETNLRYSSITDVLNPIVSKEK